MSNFDRAHEMDREMKVDHDDAFKRFLAQPLSALAISLIPAGEWRDVLPTLLRAAFDAGVGSGQGSFAGRMLMAMHERDKKP